MQKVQSAALVGLFVTCAGDGYAQPTFEKIYLSGGSAKMNLIELPSQNLFAGLAWGPGVSRLDPNGNVIQTDHYWSDSILVMQSVRQFSANQFYFVTGYQKDSCSASGNLTIPFTQPLIGKMDSTGHVIALHHYQLNAPECWHLAADLEITEDQSIITWGGGGSGIQWSFFILNVDSAGEPLWAKNFNRHGSFQFIKELSNGDLLAGINMDTAGVVVARLDAEGNFLWCKSYIRPSGIVHDALIESDDSFIIAGYTDSIASTNSSLPLPLGYDPKLFLMKLNGVGEVQWCKGYDSDPKWYTRRGLNIERSGNGNYVVLGNIGTHGYNLPYRPFLMKIDLNGDTVWTSSAGVDEYQYEAIDLLCHSDGGLIYDGIVYGDIPGGWLGAPFIFKTDSLGHLPCSEQWHPIEVLDLFPTDSSFTLASVDGAVMQPAFASDTIFDPITVYNGCILTMGAPSTAHHATRPLFYPNPSTGRFTVEFADPLLAESYYSVFDTLGKLLFQRPLPTGATLEEIDLSVYDRGTYVIMFTSVDGVIHERVVLE